MTYDADPDRRVSHGEEPFDPFAPDPTSSQLLIREFHKGRHSRGYLPHINLPLTQFITFRLADSFPESLLNGWRAELDSMQEDRRRESYRRTEAYVDAGHGACWLRRPEVAQIVESQLRYHDGVRYDLLAWTIMLNHVHLLAKLKEGLSLPRVLPSWKARSARRADETLGRRGAFWYRDYFDRYIRDEVHLANCLAYIDRNPVKAGLCPVPSEWPWGSTRSTLGTKGSPSATRRSSEVV